MYFLVFFYIILSFCDASKILFLFPTFSPSHHVILESLTKELVNNGHEITFFTIYPMKDLGKGHRNFVINVDEGLKADVSNFMGSLVNNSGSNIALFRKVPQSFRMLKNSTISLLKDPNLKKLMDEEKFDLLVINFIMNEFLVGIAEHFNCPAIMVSAAMLSPYNFVAFGNPWEIASVPHFYLQHKKNLTFLDRVINLLLYTLDKGFSVYSEKVHRDLYEEYFPSTKYPPYDVAKKRLVLLLVNQHFTQTSVRPLVPAIVEVGGFQVPKMAAPLQENIQRWIDGTEHGVIFFSLGSNAKSSFLPKEKLDIIMKTFAQLKQRIIFKWETDDLPNKPDNVLIGKWLPQNDILAQSKVVLFISHCGMASVVEAKYHGVPILAIPIFGDQMNNAKTAENEGWAINLELSTLTEEDFSEKIRELLENSKYKDTVRKLSVLFRDRPQSPLDTAVYWIEYVLRHNGAAHLRYPGADLNFIQSNSLDVITFLLLIIYISLKIIKFICKLLKFKLMGRSKKDLDKKRN